ncbi:MAG: N-acetylmuramic acid 6-phosphate etherase [Phycisphaerales bacterium]|nr:N-acetylmuramic acid 6-phosphate etherase [Phycisphaerales bacterium]MCI0631770.1 N-acetylmuramic acid 6-phosphate etherase [Phycisphaerales bacterium]MCI0677391.1 N-acetylmuramic acid 6-phosphate etherase [Phycisphaerales bacterium]
MSASPTLPPDRSRVTTEHRNPASLSLDALDTASAVRLIVEDHRAVPDAVAAAVPALATLIDQISARMGRGGRVIYIGAGTSGRLGVLDAAECPPTFQSDPKQVVGIIAGGDASLRRSSESREDDPNGAAQDLESLSLTEHDMLLGIAAGGTTPYVLGALIIAKAAGAGTALITCAEPAEPPPRCDHLIVLETGPEILTGSTRLKAGSATKLALNIISTCLFVQLGKVYSNLMVDLRATNTKLADRAIRVLIELCPELSRDDAARLLDRAAGNLKAAIVMQRLDVDLQTAQSLIAQQYGRLRLILDALE